MAYNIKKHEVDRLLSMTVILGWELIEESDDLTGVIVKLRKEISAELLKASLDLENMTKAG